MSEHSIRMLAHTQAAILSKSSPHFQSVVRASIKQDFTCIIRKDFMSGIILDCDANKVFIAYLQSSGQTVVLEQRGA